MKENISYSKEKKGIKIHLCGRVDTNNVDAVEAELQKILAETGVSEPVLDACELEYISSAGLRMLMRLRKKARNPLSIINTSPSVYGILETTGFTEMFEVSKKMREISVEGCEIIGKGAYGTVYRIDDETIVKVYASEECLSMIENEKQLAKTALIAGVPTAISYDIVRVGDTYGSVFELLRAKNFNDLLVEHPEDADSIIKQYAQFLRLVNSSKVPSGKLVSAKKKALGYLETVLIHIPDDIYLKLKELLEEIPEQDYVIHGDAQMKNIMVGEGEAMLIDMDTLSAGHPIFDLQSIYVTYFAFGEDEPENSMNFLGIPKETAAMVWEKSIGYYFDTDDEARIAELRDKIAIVGCIRFLFLIDDNQDSELFDIRVEHTVQHLRELLGRVDTLLF